MPRNKLSDLNDHLFIQLERLNDESISGEELAKEISRAKAISAVSSQLIKSAKVTVDAMKLVSNGDLSVNEIPTMIGLNKQ